MAQSELRNPEMVERIKALMLAGDWDFEGEGASFVYWRVGSVLWVADGHHRANAALEIGRELGDWSYLDRLLYHGSRQPNVPPPANRGRFSTRGWWSRLLTFLGC
jgi:hypothetical protein